MALPKRSNRCWLYGWQLAQSTWRARTTRGRGRHGDNSVVAVAVSISLSTAFSPHCSVPSNWRGVSQENQTRASRGFGDWPLRRSTGFDRSGGVNTLRGRPSHDFELSTFLSEQVFMLLLHLAEHNFHSANNMPLTKVRMLRASDLKTRVAAPSCLMVCRRYDEPRLMLAVIATMVCFCYYRESCFGREEGEKSLPVAYTYVIYSQRDR